MGVIEAIMKLQVCNQEIKVNKEELHEQFKDLRKDPRFEGLSDDIENLFLEYLKTWINTNTDVLDILIKSKNNFKN